MNPSYPGNCAPELYIIKYANFIYSNLVFRKFVLMIDFKLEGEFIPMIQLLKATDLVSSGGEAQTVVTQGFVKYNGQTDYRKRLKVKRGDVVEFNNQKINII